VLQLRSLSHLLALDRRRNFARAAEDLGISQSALSRSLQALEQQLGMRLFDRDRSGVVPTPQGQIAIERAAILLADAADLEHHLVQAAGATAGRVRFGITPMPACALLPLIVSEALGRSPAVTHEVRVRDADALWALLVSGEIEFFVANEGFVFNAPKPHLEILGRFPIGGIVRTGHPLLHGAGPDAKFPVIRSSWSGLPLPTSIERRMLGSPNVIEDFGALGKIAATSDAIWFSSSFTIPGELKAGVLCELPRADSDRPWDVGIVMYTLDRRSQSPWALSLKHSLRRHLRTLERDSQRARGGR